MAETIQYKCPCCGGRLEFDSGLQKMKCPYCDTTFDVETLEGYDDALKQDAADDMHWDAAQQPWDDAQMGVYTCKSCGGELVCDEGTAATACPFCGNPIVLTGRLSGDLKPDYVIPFKLDKKAAEAALRNHMKGKQILSTNEKYYIADHGIREAVFGGNLRDINLILENIVFLELLRRGYTVTVGKTGEKEIDFVCEKRAEKLYVQVTYLLATDETIEREFGAYAAIRDNFPKYVVSLDEFDRSRDGIKHRNLRDFLLAEKWD